MGDVEDLDWGSEDAEDDEDDDLCQALGLDQVSVSMSSRSSSSWPDQSAAPTAATAAAAAAVSAPPRPPDRLPNHARHGEYKAVLCVYQLQGTCRRGRYCQYAHSDLEQTAWQEYWQQASAPELPHKVKAPLVREFVNQVEDSNRPVPAGKCTVLQLSPAEVCFTQSNISPMFKRGHTIIAVLKQLQMQGQHCLKRIPLMKVVHFDDRYYSLDNRRLCLYRLCQQIGLLEGSVKVRFYENIPPSFREKFSTKCGGEYVEVRGGHGRCGRTLEESTFAKELFAA